MSNDNQTFKLRSISDFIDKKTNDRDRHFFIPSYQRGYRWEPKDVEYLLDDILEFIEEGKNCNENKRPYYCLQPIVVKKKEWNDAETQEKIKGWEVIDGQQRLTTLYLILSILKGDSDYKNSVLYDITYETRPELNFEHLDEVKPENNIDSFYVYQAIKTINSWIENFNKVRSKEMSCDLDDMRKCFFEKEEERNVKVIWYEGPSDDKADSIRIFNSLNKGKIRLTSSELIKACFLLHYSDDKGMCKEIASEWYRMETELQNMKFWKFLTNNTYTPGTHIDLIFDFMAPHDDTEDSDYVYLQFKNMFEGKGKIMGCDITTIWEEIKRVFGVFTFWFQNNETYHYIGYLIAIGTKLTKIYEETKALRKDEMADRLKEMIKEKINISKNDVSELKYGNPKVYDMLLLFNIETMNKMRNSRFDFAAFKEENKFDVEHISSQTTNPLQSRKDRLNWLRYLEALKNYVSTDKKDEWDKLLEKAGELTKKMNRDEEIKKEVFEGVSKKAAEIIESGSIDDEDKDRIWNLTLLDSHTNRSYGNALFPTKCKTIIDNEKEGTFIPPVTRNVFLKYYSKDENEIHQWDHVWNENDAQNYENSMIETLQVFLKA